MKQDFLNINTKFPHSQAAKFDRRETMVTDHKSENNYFLLGEEVNSLW